MAKKNDDFFLEKKSWSVVKDELLGCYFKPYVSKILHTNRPLVYVDCFAGKGKFADGNNGSPLIALETLINAVPALLCNGLGSKLHSLTLTMPRISERISQHISGSRLCRGNMRIILNPSYKGKNTATFFSI